MFRVNFKELYSRIMPYLSDPASIKAFLESFESDEVEAKKLIHRTEAAMKESKGALRTDFRIILNTINQY